MDYEKGVSNDSSREDEFSFKKEFVDSIQFDLFHEVDGSNYARWPEIDEDISIGAPHIRQRLYWVADSTFTRKTEQKHREHISEMSADRTVGSCENDSQLAYHNINGSIIGVADSKKSGWNKGAENGTRNSERIDTERCDRRASEYGEVDWLYCRDNKYRPIKSGIQPLVAGVTGRVVRSSDPSEPIDANNTQEARVMRLKGYGNAIQAQTAIAFITAYMSTV